jgi:hypothetical protein
MVKVRKLHKGICYIAKKEAKGSENVLKEVPFIGKL